MPEGPECRIIGEQLNSLLQNKSINDIIINGGRYKTHSHPFGYDNFVKNIKQNNTIIEWVKVKGKLIYFKFSNGYYLFNTLGMSGGWIKNDKKHCDIQLIYDKNQKIWFCDSRHFGTLKFINSEDELNKKLKTLGSDVLSDDFISKDQFIKLLRKYEKWDLSKFLMNQSKISGIGNYLKSEILYQTKINPTTLIKNLHNTLLEELYDNILMICRDSYNKKGVSVRDYRDTNQEYGTYHNKLKVYNRKTDDNGYKVQKIRTKDNRTTHWVSEIQIN